MRTEIAVTDILWCGPAGAVFSGTLPCGGRRRVRLNVQVHPVAGEVYEVEGVEVIYVDSRGDAHRQIDASDACRKRTSGKLVGPWLRTIPGIGEERASRILSRFGTGVLEALRDPSRLDDLAECMAPRRPTLGAKLASIVQARFVAMRVAEAVGVAEGEFYALLETYGVSDRRAARALYRLVGSVDAWGRLLRRPYAAACVLSWKDADHLGQRLLAARDDVIDVELHPERLAGACDAAMRATLRRGDTAVTHDDLLRELRGLSVAPEAALEAGVKAHRISRIGSMFRPPGAAWLERETASHLFRLASASSDMSAFVRDAEYMEKQEPPLTPGQRCAVAAALSQPVSMIQGGAGTGKTTAVRTIADVWERRGGAVVLTALSGKAALRLARSTGRPALTLARLIGILERRERSKVEGRDDRSADPVFTHRTMLVVDEASMVDLAGWRRILDLMPTGARLVAVGDVAQLPPVGLGQVFHDLVARGWMLTRLSQVMRQTNGNPILEAADQIRDGRAPSLPGYAGSRVGCFVAPADIRMIVPSMDRVRRHLMESGVPEEDILVVAARNATCRDFCELMRTDRERQGLPGRRLGPLASFVTVGEPMVATRNRYDEALMNGLVGRVAALDPFTIHFDGERCAREVSDNARAELMPAWALTGHRAQGSEARCVIVALDGGSMLTREWLYTAVTRATEQVVLVGPAAALNAGVSRRSNRSTMFLAEMGSVAASALQASAA